MNPTLLGAVAGAVAAWILMKEPSITIVAALNLIFGWWLRGFVRPTA